MTTPDETQPDRLELVAWIQRDAGLIWAMARIPFSNLENARVGRAATMSVEQLALVAEAVARAREAVTVALGVVEGAGLRGGW